jgi:hypothetical protein
VGECAGDGLQLVRLGPRGDAETIHLAGEHPGPEADALGASRLLARRVHLHPRAGDGTGSGRERKILRRIVRRFDPHQRDQVAEAPDEIGVEVQARGSREESRGKLTRRPQLRNYAAGAPKRAART